MNSEARIVRTAVALLESSGSDSLPVDPERIALLDDIDVVPMRASEKGVGVSGALVRCGNDLTILYATQIANEGLRRFSIAHELGHVYLPDHPSASTQGLHVSRAHFLSGDPYEREADAFAAALLMPNRLFDAEMDLAGEGMDAVRHLARRCGTSLTATALQYAKRSREVVATIVSAEGRVLYAWSSSRLRRYPGAQRILKGSPLPDTITRKLDASGSTRPGAAECEDASFRDWFGGPDRGPVLEEVIKLGGWGRTLTVLTGPDLDSLEDIEEREDLEESWTPRF